MSDDAQTPGAADGSGGAAAGGPASPGASSSGSSETDPRTSLEKTGGNASSAEPDPWAPPVAPGGSGRTGGPGYTVASNDPLTWPAPSVHDQQTVTSMPSSGMPTPPGESSANPFAAPEPTSPVPPLAPAGPFAPPTASVPYAAHGAPVPPPPIAPGGPGHVAYGYPGPVQGYPPPVMGPGAGGYYGWPGVQPMPSNGMGTAGLVLGIISAAIFCLWPVAIVMGALALIFGSIGRGKARRGEATNPGQALAGMICGAVGLVLGLGMLAVLISTV
ncbi:DUF4190 domain-containing protein [Streptomyces sp. NPDC093982]